VDVEADRLAVQDEERPSAHAARPLVMGVVNVTPDSFSDGGRYAEPALAIEHGLRLVREGADVVDVGGESTRPGAAPVGLAEELRRVLDVVRALSQEVRVSIDTRKPEVAAAAVEAGATLVNDVSATLAPVAAELGVGWVAMHMRGEPATMQDAPAYGDVVAEVLAFCRDRAEAALDMGVEEVWIDPGIGFGKTVEHNVALLGALDRFVATSFPVLVGTSRKRFLGVLGALGGQELQPEARLAGSLASVVWMALLGVGMVRVHDVAATRQAVDLVALAGRAMPATAGPGPSSGARP